MPAPKSGSNDRQRKPIDLNDQPKRLSGMQWKWTAMVASDALPMRAGGWRSSRDGLAQIDRPFIDAKALKPDAADQAGIYSCHRTPLESLLKDVDTCAAVKLKNNNLVTLKNRNQTKQRVAAKALAARCSRCARARCLALDRCKLPNRALEVLKPCLPAAIPAPAPPPHRCDPCCHPL